MLRIVMILSGLILLALAAIWFASPALDAAVATAAGSLVKAGAPKLAFDNTASIVLAALGVIGLALTLWAALGMGGKSETIAAGTQEAGKA